MTLEQTLKDAQYVGDGVYVKHEMLGLWLYTSDGIRIQNSIFLAPKVWAELVEYSHKKVEEQDEQEGKDIRSEEDYNEGIEQGLKTAIEAIEERRNL